MASRSAATTTTRVSARERLLAAATTLFYEEGVQSVGIDRVIERAGVAKASLYNAFGSKDELIRAYLEGRHASNAARITRAVDRAGTPRDKLLAIFDSQARQFADPTFRGCAFAAASAETHPGSCVQQVADDYRSWLRGLLRDLARDAGAVDPDGLARQLQVLYDGASLAARMDRDPSTGAATRPIVEMLIDAQTTPA